MRKFLLALGSLALSTATLADNTASCQAAASAQKLTGSVKTAFLKKCEAETQARKTLVQQTPRRMSAAPTSEFGHCAHDEKDL